jgi:formate-dependent nitrite reductase membrane component NrfD
MTEPTPTYYDLPVVKPPVWTWEVPTYFFVGGAAGASAVVACISEYAHGDGADGLARDAKWIAAVGGVLSGGLLTADLGRPERFLNMLRVFKLQSPMSVGAWTLTAFSSAAAASAFADLVRSRTNGRIPVTLVGDASAMLAAATGLVMTTYTGVLIGATAIPAWNRHARLLPVHFAASGLASAVSMLELLGHDAPALNTLGIIAAAVETAAGAVIERDDDAASLPLKETPSGWVTRAGGVLSGPLPLLIRLAAGRSMPARRAAAAVSLVGAFLTRFGWWAAGSASARDPRIPLRLPAQQHPPLLEQADGNGGTGGSDGTMARS